MTPIDALNLLNTIKERMNNPHIEATCP